MVELQVIANCILKDIPISFYLGLISLFFLGIIVLIWRKGLKQALHYGTILILIEWIIFVLGISVIFRGNSAERSINLVPLSSYFDYGEHSYLMEKVALNILNVALFVPVGLLLGFMVHGSWFTVNERRWLWVMVVGCGLSVLIEVLQLIFKRGLCEVDDVIHNVLGCMIGYGVASILKR